MGANTPPAVPPAPGRGRRPSGPRPTGPRPVARRAGPPRAGALPRAEDRAALPFARPASFLPAEPGASRAWPPLPSPPLPSRYRPTPHPARGSCRGGVRVARLPAPRRRRDRALASRLSRPSQPVTTEASGAWSAGSPRGPRLSVLGDPRQPARRSQIEPWWRRSEAELCRGRAGYIVSSPYSLPPPFSLLSSHLNPSAPPSHSHVP